MKKAPDAFRTISEVAEILDTPAHVLRFWESKFYQIRPVKRAGGRRYYRPDDVALINGIKSLLQEHHVTIRGVQRVLQEQGVKHVASLGGPLPALVGEDTVEEQEQAKVPEAAPAPAPEAEVEADAGAPKPLDEVFATRRTEEPAAPSEEPRAAEDEADAPLGTEVADDEDTTEALDTAPDTAPERVPEPAEETVTESAAHEIAPEPAAQRSGAPRETEAEDDAEPAVAARPAPRPAPPPAPRPAPEAVPEEAPEAADSVVLNEPSDRALIARRLRGMKRGALGPQRDRADMLARRIDSLLERMSEASGAGRW